ncbi:MAG: hypothetical protein WEA76_00565 [Acidimicrobiia bacterium]
MTSRSLRLLLLCASVAIGACSPEAVETPTTSTVAGSATTPSTSETTTTTAQPQTTLPLGTEDLPLSMREEIAGLITLTEELRELTFLQPPKIVVVTEEELEARVRESIAEDVEDVPADEALLELLGLIDPEVDLLQLYLDLYGEQVAGYYDGEVGELVVPAAETLSPLQKATLVHELTHVLTDQRFGFNAVYEGLIEDQRFDEAVAFLSVIEGDATLTELLYIQDLDVSARQDLLAEIFGADSTVLDTAPEFLQNSLFFPYHEGLAFVQRSYELGGFDEVNRLYVEPPTSSEQIINPRDYQRDMPIPVEVSEHVLSGYDVVFRSTWGELSFDLMFEQILGGAPEASDGWGGDAYIQWFDGSDAALLIEFVGDSPTDAQELHAALVSYVTVGMGVAVESQETNGGVVFEGDDFAFVRVVADRVWFVAAGDPAIGSEIVAALP